MTTPTITDPPTTPVRGSANFSNQVAAFLSWLSTFADDELTAFITWAEALTASLDNAANAAEWVSGTDYEIGDRVWSPTDLQLYQSTAAFNSTTDPVNDSDNWNLTEGFPVSHMTDTDNPHAVTAAQLGVEIGSDVQAHGDVLDDLNDLGVVTGDGYFLVGTGSGTFAWENGATVRTSLGLGSIATQAADSVNIDGGAIDGTTIGANSAAPGTFTTFNSAGISDDANGTKLTVDDVGCHVGHDGSVTSNPAFNNTVGVSLNNTNHYMSVCRAANTPLYVGVQSDTTLTGYYSAGNLEGSVSVSGTTVSFNGGHLSRWSRLLSEETPLKGTVMSNLDDMIEWPDEENEQLNYTKISDVEGDPNVAGVFVAWDNTDDHGDFFLGMTGDLVIRIADGVSFNRGDLLISAGDGTAKPQADDIVRSSTIAKVISSEVTGTYEDGSRLVPCVLMAC